MRAALNAMHDREAEALCELRSNESKDGPAPNSQVKDCVEAINVFWDNGGYKEKDPDAPIDMSMTGSTATAVVPEWEYTFLLEEIDDRWFVVGID